MILAEQSALWAMGLARRTAVHLEEPSEVLQRYEEVRRAHLGT